MSVKYKIPNDLKVRLIITDKFSIHDFNVPLNTFRDIAITRISLVDAKNYINADDGYFTDPRLFTSPCRKIASSELEIDISLNRSEPAKLDDDTCIIYITLDNNLNPIYYLIS